MILFFYVYSSCQSTYRGRKYSPNIFVHPIFKSHTATGTRSSLRLREREEIRQKHKKAIEDEKTFQGTQIQFFWYLFHGRHNLSPRVGECAGTFGRRCINAPLCSFQRLLPQGKHPYPFGYH